ncbi:hypothetical protein D4S03_05220 [bacterium]|nr:MAG: hypothetical protein D4S03_05220 [bacterium]
MKLSQGSFRPDCQIKNAPHPDETLFQVANVLAETKSPVLNNRQHSAGMTLFDDRCILSTAPVERPCAGKG